MKKSIIFVFVILIIMLGGVYFMNQFEHDYRSDFMYLIKDSGVVISNVNCESINFTRKAVCHFSSNESDIITLIDFLELKTLEDESGLRGSFLFMVNDRELCNYKDRISRGDKWLQSSWLSSRAGLKATTYSSVEMIFDDTVKDACIVLNIAYG